jgi:hypothetical protein
MKKLHLSLLAIIGLSLSMFIAAPSAKALTITPYACMDMGWHYRTYNKNTVFLPKGIHFKAGPGGEVVATVQGSLTVSAEYDASFSFSESAVVATAEQTFGINLKVSATIASSFSFSHPIQNGKYGNMRFGNFGYEYDFEKYYLNSYCQKTSSEIGHVLKMPSTSTWGYRYWETQN